MIPATAHLYPITPMAWALQTAGHDVRIASHPDAADAITAAGLTAVGVGEVIDLAQEVRAPNAVLDEITDSLGLDESEDNLRTAVRLYMLTAVTRYFRPDPPADGERRTVDELVEFARRWQPDLVLWDPLFFPAPVAARAAGAAHARFLWGRDQFGWTRDRILRRLADPATAPHTDLLAAVMRPTLDRFGLTFDEEMLRGQWTVDPSPEALRFDLDVEYHSVRWVPYTGAGTVPSWVHEPAGRPRVCLTLGVSGRKFFTDDGIPLPELLDGLAGLDVEVVATLDAQQLPEGTRVPGNVRMVDYLPLNTLLPTTSAIVHHGGAGTSACAVAHAVPQLMVPKKGGDNVEVAAYVETQGAGLALPMAEDPEFSVDLVVDGVRRLLDDGAFAAGAARLRDRHAETPSPNDLVPVLEELTASHRPRSTTATG